MNPDSHNPKFYIPILAIDVLIGDKEQMGKRRENKERNKEQVSNPATLDPSVASYDLQGSYDEPILVIYIYIYIILLIN